ncbi:two-component system sensor histidine kinase RpfC [Luteibacter sp. Sphag1AF]|uniref:ATP-binding protein n=1 Tax=Luteibacter sp. Sphag1AF TaxID=2587031 RepID=UPI00160BA06C|nr:ATP-binding protein [Luteibacter sp. Sphag1AF]MBB3227694.1 two-component system sensor histidine kinase RpfC [Luteibacter sp. Sphag1AF]
MGIDRANTGNVAQAAMLVDVATRLRHPRIDRIVASFREHHVSVMRAVLLGLTTVWTAYWTTTTTQPAMLQDARETFPMAVALFVASIVWMLLVRAAWLRDSSRADAIGVVANFVGVGVLLKLGFMLVITLTAVLPFLSVAVGARYGRRPFYASIVASLVILAVSAPSGYWISRPAYAVYALTLVIILPLMIFRMMDALREVSVEAIASREAQHRFISMMSHEMRTPLNTVIHSAALIDTDAMTEDQRRLVTLLASNANALLHRVNAVLDVASFNGGRLTLRHQSFGFDEVLDTVRDVCRSHAVDKDITLTFSCDPAVDGIFKGDPGRIEQVLSNLVSNAVKFTPTGGRVHVAIGLAPSPVGVGESILCTVTDTGIGIADEDKARIFRPFHQVSGGAARTNDGVGLGLYIVRSVSDQMHGSLDVADRPGGGSVFSWRFPLARAPVGARPSSELSVIDRLDEHRTRVPPLNCMVVDDHAANREIIGRILERAGHTATFCADGDEAMEHLGNRSFDVIFMDLHMPGGSGWDVIRRIEEAAGSAQSPPIVMLSADSSQEAIRLAFKGGARAYLTKPIPTPRLLDVLESIAEDRRLEQFARNWQPAIDPPVPGDPHRAPLDDMRALVSPKELREFVDLCDDAMRTHGKALRDALSRGEYPDASEALHALKNVVGNLGAPGGTRVCDDLAVLIDAGGSMSAAIVELDGLLRSAHRYVEDQRLNLHEAHRHSAWAGS